jgi:hypothetical protein
MNELDEPARILSYYLALEKAIEILHLVTGSPSAELRVRLLDLGYEQSQLLPAVEQEMLYTHLTGGDRANHRRRTA